MPRAFDDGFASGFGAPFSFATLAIKVGTVGPDPQYQDGDIIQGFSRLRTRTAHAHHLCHVKHVAKNSHGLNPLDSLPFYLLDETSQYKFERISATHVMRTNRDTQEVDVIGPTPNATGEYIHLDLYLRHQQKHPRHRLFGIANAEVWFGGHTLHGSGVLDRVWTKIEQHSAHREADYTDWPAGTDDLKHHLLIRVDDFDDATDAPDEPLYDRTDPEHPVLVKKRALAVDWRDLPGMSAARRQDVENPNVSVDVRAERKHPRGLIVRLK